MINMDDKQRLSEWAERNSDNSVFDKTLDINDDSYWVMRDEGMLELVQYDFETLPEFEALCQDIVRDEIDAKIVKIVAVSAFKNKPKDKVVISTTENMGEKMIDKLPEYIYVF